MFYDCCYSSRSHLTQLLLALKLLQTVVFITFDRILFATSDILVERKGKFQANKQASTQSHLRQFQLPPLQLASDTLVPRPRKAEIGRHMLHPSLPLMSPPAGP